jgi:hypothetical protein
VTAGPTGSLVEMALAETYETLVAELPQDWALLTAYVALEDPRRLTDARVALARSNARPVKGPGNHDFAITVAARQGRGAAPGVVHSALRMLDDLGIAGHIWFGEVFDTLRPAPAHRYGP